MVQTTLDGWQYTLRLLEDFHRDVERRPVPVLPPSPSAAALLAACEESLLASVEASLASFLPAARRLGRRTGELHLMLGTAAGAPHLVREPFSQLYQWSAYQSSRGLGDSVIDYRAATDRFLLPSDPDELRLLMDSRLLERTLYELAYRPDWVHIPLTDLRELLECECGLRCHRPCAR